MKKRAGADRRSGQDRRVVYDLFYFSNGGVERRKNSDRRKPSERRTDWVRISSWSSARVEVPKKLDDDRGVIYTLRRRLLNWPDG